MNCPMGFQLVTEQDECIKSATALGKLFAHVGCYATEIPGCLYNGDTIWLSTCKSTHASHHVGVCKGEYLA